MDEKYKGRMKPRRPPIPPNKRHRDRKNDYRRKPKHPNKGSLTQ